jgi:hypothetical protein
MSITLTVKRPKPRNPLVLPSRSRAAGAHAGGKRRQQEQRALSHELQRLQHPSP